MAKKATTANTEKKARKPREKKTVEKKNKAEYSKFISTTQKDIILKHLDRIEEICRTYQGINECPLDVWKELDSIVIEVGKAYYDSDDENDKKGFFTYMRVKPKKRATYSLTQRVMEMEHKNFILGFCERIKDADEERKVYYTHLIFCHLAIWLEENGKGDK